MLIFNCSKAFAEFIEPKSKEGTPRLVLAAPSPNLADDAELLRDNSGQKPAHLQQWVVHLVRIRRRACIFAMEADTRYAMVFTGLKKGDLKGFINQLIERLANEMAFAAGDLGMMVDFDAAMEKFLARHRDFRFFLRADRSVQAHLKDVVWHLQDQAEMAGELPEGHEECGMFDESANDILRSTKGRKDYFVPAEEMLCQWLTDYAGLTAQGESKLRAQIRANKRRFIQD
ncbi:hypothetical protein SAMN05660284_01504 [Formivibrio citricus]|uniref:DUF6933 domain-containing protein n=1 Tax=Formivibrio citricus TaxID=83765 RepID=A0A1I4Z2V7_9NEIS|nr:hypothetical protein [Formivibrio citricus]SFN44527.1 hypothetical protein SAMN05660284_01504 [Formivibrio citricus]